ncbi:GNAT family N-acetyltransferase [Deinococcus sp.]|uniref:GNAT family N-acetyltransferase n=1 Tax=Deinococcus sp. TaxID=47478 RepID=UPI0025DD89F9|nr:GNAT family N-acetyltransferase [Deinococcus sp.]
MTPAETLTFGPMRTSQDAAAFRALNEEWISQIFSLEPEDIRLLGDPQTHIIGRGGQVYLARLGERVVGCAALVPVQGGVFELSKMSVDPTLRGQGLGRKLLEYVMAQAPALGAASLFLGSSTKLPNAVRLYESLGFLHFPPERRPDLPYVRADVFMEKVL